jgi:hypothetical protein
MIRVFYHVTETQVQVLAIVTKGKVQAWLDDRATPTPKDRGAGGSER